MARRLRGIQLPKSRKGSGRNCKTVLSLGKKQSGIRASRLSVATRAMFIRLEKRRKSLLGRTTRPYNRLRRKTKLQENEQRGIAPRNRQVTGRQYPEYDYLRGQASTQRGTSDNEAHQTFSTAYKKLKQGRRRGFRSVRRLGYYDNRVREIGAHGVRYGTRPSLLRRNTQTLDAMGDGK